MLACSANYLKEIEAMRFIACLFITLFLAACASRTEVPLANDMYKISLRGNPLTSQEKAQNYLMKRGAEVTLTGGRKNFSVVQSNFMSGIGTSTIVIKTFKDKPEHIQSYDAQAIYGNLASSRQLKKLHKKLVLEGLEAKKPRR